MTRSQALAAARGAVATNLCCEPDDFLREDTTFTEAGLRPGRMPFYLGRPHLALATFGAGVVVTASSSWLPWARRAVAGLDRDEVFSIPCLSRLERHVRRSGQPFAGPQHRFVCSEDLWQLVSPPPGLGVDTVPVTEIASLNLNSAAFAHALSDRGADADGVPERPSKVGAVALHGDEVVGVATASADCGLLWQIGVSVIENWRGCGVGAAVVSACARAVLDCGIAPYLFDSPIPSALASGRPARRVRAGLDRGLRVRTGRQTRARRLPRSETRCKPNRW